ncbi:MAG: hypothetical protein HY021_03625 [Burkholderiales bacterium]|nr:hypothetical protein [Burkholderiales bacterium]
MTYSVSNVGTISSAGLGSGLDVNAIVTQLMALEQKPLTQLQAAATDLKTGVSTFGKLQSYFSALRDKANALTTPSLWTSTTASSADASAVTVSTGATAATGNYAIKTTTLARGQTVVSSAASAATINEGTLTIELGTWVTTPAPGFTAKAGSSPIAITVGTGETDLPSIRDKINAATTDVVASIVTDATGSRLSIRSKATGAENAFRGQRDRRPDDQPAQRDGQPDQRQRRQRQRRHQDQDHRLRQRLQRSGELHAHADGLQRRQQDRGLAARRPDRGAAAAHAA